MTLAAGQRLGPYEVLAPVGAGGMGEVYRARDTRLGRDVAVRVLPSSFSADADHLRRFEQESRAAGILNHPGITAVHDLGVHDGAPYVVQELLEGETLSGRRAFHGDSAAETMSAILREGPPDLSVTNQGVSPGLERIVRHCIEEGPERQFHSAYDLAFDLEALTGSSASGRTDAPASSRHPRRWMPAVVAAALLLAVAGAYSVGHSRGKRSIGFVPSFVREADWSPDGAELAVIRDVGGKDRQEFPAWKVFCETGGYFSDPRFRPGGDRIAFFEHPFRFDDRGEVAVVDLAGRKTVLPGGYWGEEGLAWSLAGDEVMSSAGTAYNNLQLYEVSLSGKRRIALESADGRWLATRDGFFREMPVLAPGQARERDLSWLDLSDPVAQSADGGTLLFTKESGSVGVNDAACLRKTDGSAVVRLGEGSAFDLSRDGRWALASVPTTPQQLLLYPTGAGEPRRLERGGLVSYESAQLFPDGRRVLACGHEEGTGVRRYVQEIDGGKPRPATPEGTSQGFVAPDGQQVPVNAGGGLVLLSGRRGRGPARGGRDSRGLGHPVERERPAPSPLARRISSGAHRTPRARDGAAGAGAHDRARGPHGSPARRAVRLQLRREEPRVCVPAHGVPPLPRRGGTLMMPLVGGQPLDRRIPGDGLD